jgi:hypothetical protein
MFTMPAPKCFIVTIESQVLRTFTPASVGTNTLTIVTTSTLAHSLMTTNTIPTTITGTCTISLITGSMTRAVKSALGESAVITTKTFITLAHIGCYALAYTMTVIDTSRIKTIFTNPTIIALTSIY